ncbi:MAG TPA: ABC transporter permease [Puia sp.]|jgi:putative ABC transport system permease protein|nr:ABC transporter permease [Puia sp.]
MFRNFLKIALRNLARRKGYAVLNILGLAIGITCCLVIFEYVAYERSYDRFEPNADRLYRVQDEDYQGGRMVLPCAAAMPGVADGMLHEFPEVENACRFYRGTLILGDESRNIRIRESTIYYADPAVLPMFGVKMLYGDQGTALTGPGKLLLSATEARKFFGDEDPVGKVLTIQTGIRPEPMTVEVTGVYKDEPANSHLKFPVLVSYPTLSVLYGTYGRPEKNLLETSYGWTDFYTYVLLRPGASAARLSAKLPAFIDKHYNNLPLAKNSGDSLTLSLMPVKDIHLDSHYTEEAEPGGDGQSVSFLFLIAFLIIGIAWINYINLATARSLERAKEVGVRKVLGALRGELIRQFMMESLLMNSMALLVALGLTLAVNPFFVRLTDRPMSRLFSMPYGYWEIFLGLFIAGTLLSGVYPALVLSRYRAVTVLKGLFKNASGGQWLRRGLIVGQFAASIILIAGTIVVYRQVQYMRSQSLGVNIDETLVVRAAGSSLPDSSYRDVYESFKNEILQQSGVRSMTASSEVMGNEILWSTDWHRLHSPSRQVSNIFHVGVDKDFVRSYGLHVIAGRDFSPDFGMDKKAIILNETAAKTLGITPQQAIGELMSGGQSNMDSMQVVGVIADYHNEGLQKAIQPLLLFLNRNTRHFYSIKMQASNPAATIAAIKRIWDRHFPGDPYDYFFLDENFDRQYAENQRFGEVFGLFALFAIAIACFGLLGLSAYNVLQRTKEIGIRKVLGASTENLLMILSKDFLLLVGVAFVIAVPVTWLAMDSWLQSFAYRIGISWWIFGLAGVVAAAIAFVTVAGQAMKAAMQNPVRSLRTE